MTKSRAIASVLAFSMALATAMPSFAQDTGGVKVDGDINQTTLVLGSNTNRAAFLAKAVNSVGSIHEGTDVGGDVGQTTLVLGSNTNSAAFLAKACNSVGSIGAETKC